LAQSFSEKLYVLNTCSKEAQIASVSDHLNSDASLAYCQTYYKTTLQVNLFSLIGDSHGCFKDMIFLQKKRKNKCNNFTPLAETFRNNE